jgi:hypothetical protein
LSDGHAPGRYGLLGRTLHALQRQWGLPRLFGGREDRLLRLSPAVQQRWDFQVELRQHDLVALPCRSGMLRTPEGRCRTAP